MLPEEFVRHEPEISKPRPSLHDMVAMADDPRYIAGVNYLTRQEQMFVIVVLGLLLTGWAVKTWRTAHPPTVTAVQPAKP